MSALIGKPRLTAEEYLQWEAQQPEKHEYVHGEVFAMVGVTRKHNLVAGNIYRRLADQLDSSQCQAFFADVKLGVNSPAAYFYPDVMVTCDENDLRADMLIRSPLLIVEVLSASTAAYDRGNKFAAYRQIASLREYILIDPEAQIVDGFRRAQDGTWTVAEFRPSAPVAFASLEIEIGWAENFAGTLYS